MSRVFISYSHDSEQHRARVLALANQLRSEGLDCIIDRYIDNPPEGWPVWMIRQVEKSDFVLVICTCAFARRFNHDEERGKGLGATWEGAVITTEMYQSAGRNAKFIPVVMVSEDVKSIPTILSTATRYDLSDQNGYELLYRRLTSQPLISLPTLGAMRKLPTLDVESIGLVHHCSNDHGSMNRSELFAEVHRLLKSNGAIFEMYGPGSHLANSNPMSKAAELWRLRKSDTIIPNNMEIIKIVKANRTQLSLPEYEVFTQFELHAVAYAETLEIEVDRNTVPRFPLEFRSMVTRIVEHDGESREQR